MSRTRAAVERVWTVCNDLWEEEEAFLSDLVRFPSVRGDTNPIQEHIADELERMGMEVTKLGIDPAVISTLPGYSPAEWSYDELYNVVARARGAGAGGKSLVLNGHVDVVSPMPVQHWTHSPWEPHVTGGRMYGRGAADMKAGIAAMLYAVKAVRRAGIELQGDVTIQTVIDEECTGNGTLACLAAGYGADAAIIPEPTSLTGVSAHPGVFWCRIAVRGLGAHAESASRAVNAAEKSFIVIQALRTLEAERNTSTNRPAIFRDVEHPLNFNLGTMHAGDWPSSVPEVCTLEVRLSYYPGEDFADVRQQVIDRIGAVAMTDEWLRQHPPTVTFFGFQAEPAEYDMDSQIMQVLSSVHRDLTREELRTGPLTSTIDNRFFQLYYGIPSACYGPTGGRLHAPDEWVDLESIKACTKVLGKTLIDWCGTT